MPIEFSTDLIRLGLSLTIATMPDLVIGPDDPRSRDVVLLLEAHLTFAHEHSPREDVHALDGEGLLAGDITFFSVREDGRLLGIGALKFLDATHAEIKSVHTAGAERRRGIGAAMVSHLIEEARARGFSRLSLETGSMDAFGPSRMLYESLGFVACPPFADYVLSPNSAFMTLDLNRSGD